MRDELSAPELKKRIKKLEQSLEKNEASAREIRTREKMLRDLVDHAMVGIFHSTQKGRLLLTNRKFVEIFGFKSSKDCLASVSDVGMLYVNQEERRLILEKLRAKGAIERHGVRFRRQDGETFLAELKARAIERDDGEIIYEGFVTDLKARKRSEEALIESERRFRALVEQAGDAFWTTDDDGNILDVNRLSCESLGYSREELLAMNIAEVDIEATEKNHKGNYWEVLVPGQHITLEGTHRRKDGRTFPVEIRLGRLDLGDRILILGITRNITERKQAENRLRKAFEEIKNLKNLLEEENIYLRQQIEMRHKHEKIVGKSGAIRKVVESAEKVARENTCVLILGETGTGKELLAREIHNMSSRKGHSMITVNCAALPSTLIEGELFGREKGAYTGAVSKQVGRFEMAKDSTIFLDEIGDIASELQSKMLRVLEDGTFERIGSSRTITTNARVIAATNCDLDELVKERKFRRDLYYRLNVFPITLPPLRQRREDIPLLAKTFVEEFSNNMGKPVKSITRETMDRLENYSWPGNVRELRNVIERAMILSSGSILIIDLRERDDPLVTKDMTMEAMQREHIFRVLEKTRWRIRGHNGAAEILDLKPTTLENRMKKLGIHRK